MIQIDCIGGGGMGLVTMSGNQMHGHLPAPFMCELTTKNFRGGKRLFPLGRKKRDGLGAAVTLFDVV